MTARPRDKSGSLLLPLILIAAGILLLLSNLGLIEGNVWPSLLRYWPVSVIVLGLDLLLGRPSRGAALGTVIFACLALAIGAGLFHVFAPGAWTVQHHSLSYPVGDATSATITLSCERCAIAITGAASAEKLIEGAVTVHRDERLDQTTFLDRSDGSAAFSLTSEGRFPFRFAAIRESLPWEVRLNPELPLSIRVATAGMLELDLRPFLTSAIDVTAGERPCALWLPDRADSTTYLSGDDISIRVPDGVGVRIHSAPDVQVTASGDFVQTEADLESADYDRSAVRADVLLRPGTGTVTVEPAASGDPPEHHSI